MLTWRGNPNFAKLSSMHFYAWKKGLKTGMYYLRSKAAVDPIKFTLSEKHQRKFVDEASTDGTDRSVGHDSEKQSQVADGDMQTAQSTEGASCTMEDGCLMCGS